MSALADHLLIVPIVLPLAAGASMLLFEEQRHRLKATISVAASLLVLAAAVALIIRAQSPLSHVYPIGNWAAPFGIVLVVDRLTVLDWVEQSQIEPQPEAERPKARKQTKAA